MHNDATMTPHELEIWTRTVVDGALSGQPTEDSRIELKSEWVEREKAAHQLAAHANAVSGTRILWIIGVDEKRRALTNPAVTEKSNWLAGLTSFFDGFPPTLLNDVNIIIQDKSVIALYFDTEQGAPYVVRRGTGGSYPEHVVPWREGTAKRAARRHELLRILVSKRSLADLKAELEFNLMHLTRQDPKRCLGNKPLRQCRTARLTLWRPMSGRRSMEPTFELVIQTEWWT